MRDNDTFRLVSEEQAGAIIGTVVAALMLYDFTMRALEKFFG